MGCPDKSPLDKQGAFPTSLRPACEQSHHIEIFLLLHQPPFASPAARLNPGPSAAPHPRPEVEAGRGGAKPSPPCLRRHGRHLQAALHPPPHLLPAPPPPLRRRSLPLPASRCLPSLAPDFVALHATHPVHLSRRPFSRLQLRLPGAAASSFPRVVPPRRPPRSRWLRLPCAMPGRRARTQLWP
jgi:hypothetical protein